MIISKERVILFLLPRKSIHCEKQANSVSDFIAWLGPAESGLS